MADNAPEQVFLGLEVVIEQRPRDAELVGDLLQAGLPETAAAEELDRVAEEFFLTRYLDGLGQSSSIPRGHEQILLISTDQGRARAVLGPVAAGAAPVARYAHGKMLRGPGVEHVTRHLVEQVHILLLCKSSVYSQGAGRDIAFPQLNEGL